MGDILKWLTDTIQEFMTGDEHGSGDIDSDSITSEPNPLNTIDGTIQAAETEQENDDGEDDEDADDDDDEDNSSNDDEQTYNMFDSSPLEYEGGDIRVYCSRRDRITVFVKAGSAFHQWLVHGDAVGKKYLQKNDSILGECVIASEMVPRFHIDTPAITLVDDLEAGGSSILDIGMNPEEVDASVVEDSGEDESARAVLESAYRIGLDEQVAREVDATSSPVNALNRARKLRKRLQETQLLGGEYEDPYAPTGQEISFVKVRICQMIHMWHLFNAYRISESLILGKLADHVTKLATSVSQTQDLTGEVTNYRNGYHPNHSLPTPARIIRDLQDWCRNSAPFALEYGAKQQAVADTAADLCTILAKGYYSENQKLISDVAGRLQGAITELRSLKVELVDNDPVWKEQKGNPLLPASKEL